MGYSHHDPARGAQCLVALHGLDLGLMEYILTIGDLVASCSCGNFKVNLDRDKHPQERIQRHAEAHGAEPDSVVIVRHAWDSYS